MELVQYLRLKLVPLVVAFIVGAVLLALVVLGNSRDDNEASADVLVRPSEAVAQIYAPDPDRYVNTQLSILDNSPSLFTEPAEMVGLSVADLRDALSVSHEGATDVATITVRLRDADQAVIAANAVAKKFVEYLRSTADGGDADQITQQKESVQRQLTQAQSRIQSATRTYQRNNPDAGSVSPQVVAPEASTQVTALTSRLQALVDREVQVSGSADNPSRVLKRADSTTSATSSDIVVFLAAVVGLVLVLVVIAALGMTVSRKILGQARWERAAGDLGLHSAVQATVRGKRQRQRFCQRISWSAVERAAGGSNAVLMVPFPARTARLARAEQLIESALADNHEVSSVSTYDGFLRRRPQLRAGKPGAPAQQASGVTPPVTFLMVDVRQAEFDDIETLAAVGDQWRRTIVPVLV